MINSKIYNDLMLNDAITSIFKNEIYTYEAPEDVKFPCLVISFVGDSFEYWAGDKPWYTTSEIQLDVYTEGSFESIVRTVRRVIESKGYYRGLSFSEKDDKLNGTYRYTMRYNIEIFENNEEEGE